MESNLGKQNHQEEEFLEYEIVRINYKYSYSKGRWLLKNEYLSIIENYVGNGWRLLQIHQSNTAGIFAYPEFLEIIFTRSVLKPISGNPSVKYGIIE